MAAAAAADGTATSDAAAQKVDQPAGDGQKPVADKPGDKVGDKPADKAGEKPADKAGEQPGGDAAAAVPETYALTIPDDGQAFLDDTDLAAFAVDAKAAGLTNAEAQDTIARHVAAMAARSKAFRAETAADPTLGGEQLADTERLMTLALDRLAPAGTELGDELRRDLQKTGYGNKRSVVALLRAAGALMAEDRPGSPGSGGTGDGKEYQSPKDLYKHTTPAA